MSIVINKELCKNCGNCANVCPGSLIKRDEDGQIFMKYPKDCWGCSSCIKECAFDAISLYLGADIGGMGSQMSVENKGALLLWNIRKMDGTTDQIVIDKKEANKY